MKKSCQFSCTSLFNGLWLLIGLFFFFLYFLCLPLFHSMIVSIFMSCLIDKLSNLELTKAWYVL